MSPHSSRSTGSPGGAWDPKEAVWAAEDAQQYGGGPFHPTYVGTVGGTPRYSQYHNGTLWLITLYAAKGAAIGDVVGGYWSFGPYANGDYVPDGVTVTGTLNVAINERASNAAILVMQALGYSVTTS